MEKESKSVKAYKGFNKQNGCGFAHSFSLRGAIRKIDEDIKNETYSDNKRSHRCY